MSKVKTDNKAKAYVENYPPLKEWLEKHKARCDWQLPYGNSENPSAFIEQWRFSTGKTALIVVHAKGHGWDVLTGLDDDNAARTLADAETRLGLS